RGARPHREAGTTGARPGRVPGPAGRAAHRGGAGVACGLPSARDRSARRDLLARPPVAAEAGAVAEAARQALNALGTCRIPPPAPDSSLRERADRTFHLAGIRPITESAETHMTDFNGNRSADHGPRYRDPAEMDWETLR